MNKRRPLTLANAACSLTRRSTLALAFMALACCAMGSVTPARAQADQPSAKTTAPGEPFTPAQLEALLPEKVYFQGQSAPVQVRNSGGTRFANGAVIFAVLVDTSGYSSAVQGKYQFYFVTETDVHFGGKALRPGAYGAGFVEGDRFVVMDIGGHTLAEGVTSTDNAMAHPRPLQVRAERPDAVRLYMGRRYVSIQAAKP